MDRGICASITLARAAVIQLGVNQPHLGEFEMALRSRPWRRVAVRPPTSMTWAERGPQLPLYGGRRCSGFFPGTLPLYRGRGEPSRKDGEWRGGARSERWIALVYPIREGWSYIIILHSPVLQVV